jgi:hypothetical protein
MKLTDRIRKLHAWLKARSAYFLGAMALFPQLWLSSPEIQALLPATWVSRIATTVALIAFAGKLVSGLRRLPKPADDTDEAGA